MTVQQVDDAICEMKKKGERLKRDQVRSTGIENGQQSGTSEDNSSGSPYVTELLKCIKTSCIPIGYTNEAATEARNKMFALWMTFGPPALLFTFSPCDECSLKMQLYATMETYSLPSIHTSVEILTKDLGIRKSLRVRYPGCCAREFDSLLQIITRDLIGWDLQKETRSGIFGKVNAVATGVEEQGRTSLHGHIIIWVHDYYNLQHQLFSDDKVVKIRAMQEMEEYLETVLSGSFHISRDEVMESLHGKCNCTSNLDQVNGVSL
jgi:hypothetical protein